jgi:hypothetical protein
VRQLPAMRFGESDAVEQQRFGAPTHKRQRNGPGVGNAERGRGAILAGIYVVVREKGLSSR